MQQTMLKFIAKEGNRIWKWQSIGQVVDYIQMGILQSFWKKIKELEGPSYSSWIREDDSKLNQY